MMQSRPEAEWDDGGEDADVASILFPLDHFSALSLRKGLHYLFNDVDSTR